MEAHNDIAISKNFQWYLLSSICKLVKLTLALFVPNSASQNCLFNIVSLLKFNRFPCSNKAALFFNFAILITNQVSMSFYLMSRGFAPLGHHLGFNGLSYRNQHLWTASQFSICSLNQSIYFLIMCPITTHWHDIYIFWPMVHIVDKESDKVIVILLYLTIHSVFNQAILYHTIHHLFPFTFLPKYTPSAAATSRRIFKVYKFHTFVSQRIGSIKKSKRALTSLKSFRVAAKWNLRISLTNFLAPGLWCIPWVF